MEKMDENIPKNIANEAMFIGAIYSDCNLLVSCQREIRSKYDFYAPDLRFLYDMAELIYDTYSQVFDESAINAFMIQDDERKAEYRRLGGYKTIKEAMKLANVEDFDNYKMVLKKYSLLREYYNTLGSTIVDRMMQHKNFDKWDATHLKKLVLGKVNKINTVIMADKTGVDLATNATLKAKSYLSKPQMGLPMIWDIISSYVKGFMLGRVLGIGMLSNAGKSRSEVYLLLHIALLYGEKILFIDNEMDSDSIFNCMMITIMNSKAIKERYGWNISIKEEDFTLGRYKYDDGRYIEREYDEEGNPILSDEEYAKYVEENSSQYREMLKIATFLEEKENNLIFFQDISSNYNDVSIEYEIRRYVQVYDIKYIGYGTLKNFGIEDWGSLKQTTTKIREIASDINVCVCVFIQLTDDTHNTPPLDLTSNNIANAKQLKHPLDVLFLCKEIKKSEYNLYEYINYNDEWGDAMAHNLDPKKRYYAFVCDKNRLGGKPIVCMEVDLDYNTWNEVGICQKRIKG